MRNLQIIIFSLLTSTLMAQNPNWTINSADYEYSMSFTSVAKIGDDEVRNSDDYVSAWINGELRGVTQAFYVAATDRYYFLLNVYSNSVNNDSITFKIYDVSSDSQIDFENGEEFSVLENRGTYSDPYELVTPPGIQLSYFEIAGIDQTVDINSETKVVTIQARDSIDVTNLIASYNFNFSTGSTVDGVSQTSGVTSNDFSDTVHYIVGSSSQPGVVEDWSVIVNQATFLNEYELQGMLQDVQINNQNRLVTITLQDSTDLNNIVANFEFSFIDSLYLNGIKQSITTSITSYSGDVVYTSYYNGIGEDWTIEVRQPSYPHQFQFSGFSQNSNYNSMTKTININIEQSVDISNLVATFDFGDVDSVLVGGVKQVSGTTTNDFSSPVVYTTYSGSVSIDFTIEVDVTILGIKDFNGTNVTGYPNPTSGLITITGIEGAYEMVLVNELGLTLSSWNGVSTNDVQVSLEDLSAGVYFIQVIQNRQLEVLRVILE